MDNAGDWLYIVFLVIAGISSLFSSKNKKKRPKQILGQPDKDIVTSEKEVPAKGFWEILEEMQKPEPVKQPAAAPKPFLAGEKMADRQSSAGTALPPLRPKRKARLRRSSSTMPPNCEKRLFTLKYLTVSIKIYILF